MIWIDFKKREWIQWKVKNPSSTYLSNVIFSQNIAWICHKAYLQVSNPRLSWGGRKSWILEPLCSRQFGATAWKLTRIPDKNGSIWRILGSDIIRGPSVGHRLGSRIYYYIIHMTNSRSMASFLQFRIQISKLQRFKIIIKPDLTSPPHWHPTSDASLRVPCHKAVRYDRLYNGILIIHQGIKNLRGCP